MLNTDKSIISKSSSPTGPELYFILYDAEKHENKCLIFVYLRGYLYPGHVSLYVLYYKQLPLPTQKYLGETGEIAILQKVYLPNRQFRCTQHDESPLFHSLSSFFQSRLLQQWAHQSVLKFSTKKGNLEQSYTSLSQWQKSRLFFPSI